MNQEYKNLGVVISLRGVIVDAIDEASNVTVLVRANDKAL